MNIEYFKSELHQHKSRITKDLLNAGSGYSYDAFVGYCLNSLRTKPSLLTCIADSVTGAFLHCAGMGLLPNTPYNHVTISPYYRNDKDEQTGEWTKKKEARVLTGYQGWVDIILRNTATTHISAEIVLKSDKFREIKGLKPDIIHIPDPNKTDTQRIAAYAVAWIKDAVVPTFTVVYKADIDAIKAISKKSDPDAYLWEYEEADPFGWMWKKTAIKQLAKLLPKSKFLDQTINLDNLVNTGVGSIYLTQGGELKFIDNQKAKVNQKISAKKDKSNDVVNNLLLRRKNKK